MTKQPGNVYAIVRMTFLLFIVVLVGSCSQPKSLVLVCGDSKVLLVNVANTNDSIPDIIWSWDAHLANDLPDLYRTEKFNSIDDCKSIRDGSQIMVSSSSGAVVIVNMEDKRVLFHAEVPNAHSIELLPGDKIVAAASTAEKGNRLMLFNIGNPVEIFSDSLYSAHGVVWDEKRNSLFALGYDVLREYKMQNDELVKENEWVIPGISGHDLQMAQGGNKLLITENTGSWIFDLGNQQFSKIDGFPDDVNIKSLNQNKEGKYVYTVAEESWWTYHVRFFNPQGVLLFPDIHVYKSRWFDGN